MQQHVILIRGINVGGKNKVPMAQLRERLETAGLVEVRTYIASGNVIARSELPAVKVGSLVERELAAGFELAGGAVRVHVITADELREVVRSRPPGFGDEPDTYHCDVLFLLDHHAEDVLHVFDPREGVDRIWPGPGVVYSQRLSAQRTKSRLSRMMGTPEYAAMTIRNWRTTTTLVGMLDD
jgi:uncharacterized protein (DUF1697 family)